MTNHSIRIEPDKPNSTMQILGNCSTIYSPTTNEMNKNLSICSNCSNYSNYLPTYSEIYGNQNHINDDVQSSQLASLQRTPTIQINGLDLNQHHTVRFSIESVNKGHNLNLNSTVTDQIPQYHRPNSPDDSFLENVRFIKSQQKIYLIAGIVKVLMCISVVGIIWYFLEKELQKTDDSTKSFIDPEPKNLSFENKNNNLFN